VTLKVPVGRRWETIPDQPPAEVRTLLDDIGKGFGHPDPKGRRLRKLLTDFETRVFRPEVVEKLSRASVTTRFRAMQWCVNVWGPR
jgi:hypothetical protein